MAELIIFYDGCCSLCTSEAKKISDKDVNGLIQFENLNGHDFRDKWPDINVSQANRIIQGVLKDGRVVCGLDVIHAAWTLLGEGYKTAWMRWPAISWIADICYRLLAMNRYRLSKWVGKNAQCEYCFSSRTKIQRQK